MKVKEAIAIMNDENSTVAQLMEVATTFRMAGLKGLLTTVQGTIRRRIMPKPLDRGVSDVSLQEILLRGLAYESLAAGNLDEKITARALLLAKCDRIIADYEGVHGSDANRIPRSTECSCSPDEYSMCAARTCPNSCDWPQDKMFDYLPLDER